MFKKWFGGMFGGNGPDPLPTWARPTKSPFSPRPEPNTEPISAEPNVLYTIKRSDIDWWKVPECWDTEIDTMECHTIDIHPPALGADTISLTDFRGNTFTIPKKSIIDRPVRGGYRERGAIYESRAPPYTYASLVWRSENICYEKEGLR